MQSQTETQVLSNPLQRKARVLKARRAVQRYYQRNPVDWLVKYLGEKEHSFYWSKLPGYEKHRWDGTPDPFYRTCKSLTEYRNVGIESATSVGKTYMVARIAYWFLECFRDSLVVTTAPTQQQLKNVLWSEINKLYPTYKRIQSKAELYTMRVLPHGSKLSNPHQQDMAEEIEDDWQMIGVVSGVKADEASATRLQGFHREHMLFIVEEAAGISPAVLTAIKNTCTAKNNLIVAIGNPDSVTDTLHQFCELQQVEHIRISGYDHPNIVTASEIIPAAVSIKSIEERRLEYGEDSNFYKSRVRGIAPEQSSDALILHEWMVACCKWREEYDNNILDENNASVYDSNNSLGVDVANSENGDKACLVWGKRNSVELVEEFQCPDANALADNVILPNHELEALKDVPNYRTAKLVDFDIDSRHIAVDAVGVGAGTINQFTRMGYPVYSVIGGVDRDAIPVDSDDKPLYSFANARAQIFFQLRLDIMRREIIFNVQDPYIQAQLIKQLTLIKYKVSNTNIIIESKEQIKKRLGGMSPNILDAVAYWNWIRKPRTQVREQLPFIVN